MRPKEIQKLIELVEKSHITELEVSRFGKRVRIRKNPENTVPIQENIVVTQPPSTPAPMQTPPILAPSEPTAEIVAKQEQKKTTDILSPMVGTYYRAPAPDAAPYVEVGTIVSEGQVLCIIEAMKLMNEIEAEFPCRIVEILVDNAQPVEYNQLLFRVEKI